jgi:hypothetical protein
MSVYNLDIFSGNIAVKDDYAKKLTNAAKSTA